MDKVIAITGASGGIGEAAARLLAARGAKLVLAARREDKLAALAKELGAEYHVTDVAKREDVAALVDFALAKFGRLDVLVSNAGIGPISMLEDLQIDDWERMIDVNFKSVLWGIAAALPLFKRQGSGQFVNTISTAGLKIVPMQAVYAATKNAARTVSEGLRQESGPNIRVTTISPGFVRTDFAESMTNPDVKAAIVKKRDEIAIPADAVARAIVFAIEQPPDVDINEIVIRPTAQA